LQKESGEITIPLTCLQFSLFLFPITQKRTSSLSLDARFSTVWTKGTAKAVPFVLR